MAMGGVPHYLKEAEKGKSATQLIDDICFSPQGLLREEYKQLYHSLFRNAEHHIAIIEALAARPQGMTRKDVAVICMMHVKQIKSALGVSGVYTKHSSWKFRGDDVLPGAQIDMIIDRADQIIHLCEAKFTKENYVLSKDAAARLRLRKTIFKQAAQTKKAVFTTLLTTYPALQNKYYLEEVDSEITMEKLFER